MLSKIRLYYTFALIFSMFISIGNVSTIQAQAVPLTEKAQGNQIQASRTEQSASISQQAVEVSTFLQRQFAEASGPISFLIVLQEQPDVEEVLSATQLSEKVGAASRVARATAIYNSLTHEAYQSQQGLRAMLERQKIPYRSFYIVNMIEVTGDIALVSQLRKRSDVDRLIPNPWVRGQLALDDGDTENDERAVEVDSSARYLHKSWSWLTELGIPEGEDTLDSPEMTLSAASVVQQPYGLAYTGAPNVWAQGYTGQGIILASQDTGVEWTHPALKKNYRGWDADAGVATHANNWFDAWGSTGRPSTGCENDAQVPCDDNGHGTHTVGTLLGDTTGVGGATIGMAPDAEWIGCRNMDNGTGTIASYTACFEFFLAPYPQDGNKFTDGNPALAPHIINNSWACPPEEGCDPDDLRQVVETVRAAGIMVVASAGNEGRSTANSCSTVKNPIAIHDASFSVGAHDASGDITSFSSRGPVTIDGSGRAKPDIVAPGAAIESAWPTYRSTNSPYRTIQGTSMSAPHVAGASALIWSAASQLIGEIDLTEQVLIKSATAVDTNFCGESNSPVTPNHTYGYGRLNVEAAVAMAQSPASADVTLLNCDGSALSDALVTLTDDFTGYQYAARTNAAGVASIPALYANNGGDSFTLSANAGVATFPSSAVTVMAGATVAETVQATSSCAQPLSFPLRLQNGDDATGIPFSIVKLTSQATGLIYTTQADANGNATFSNLYQGSYSLTISAAGHTFNDEIIELPPIGSSTIPPMTFESVVDNSMKLFIPVVAAN